MNNRARIHTRSSANATLRVGGTRPAGTTDDTWRSGNISQRSPSRGSWLWAESGDARVGWERKQPGAGEADLRALAALIRAELPETYRAFLEEQDGGEPS